MILRKVLLWMMLLSCIIQANKYDFMVFEVGQVATNRGISFDESVVPTLLYDLSILPILKDLKATYEQKTSIDNERIILRDSVITNYQTKIVIQYKLDKAKKKKTIIITAIISYIGGFLTYLGIDLWVSSLKN